MKRLKIYTIEFYVLSLQQIYKLGWLTRADYQENGSSLSRFRTAYWYDKMGNFTSIERWGLQDGGGYDYIDDLEFTYTGNQVKTVEDNETDPTYNGAFNFVDGANGTTEYTYDQNGNMTKDLNKNISSISYNLLNLPSNITYSNGKSATYIYDANGKKLRTSYKASASATAVPTDYCGNMIYENGVLKQILVDGGYMTVTGTPFYFYYLQDHLGSNRVVVSPAGTATQVNHYYPFGGLFGESTGNTVQRFRYNGKEFDRTHGIDWYDYGARHMSPDVGRFTTIDPLAEKDYATTPYAYCSNNPLVRVDEDGRIWDTILDVGFLIYDVAEAYSQYAQQNSVNASTKAAIFADAAAILIPGVTGAGLAVRSGGKAAKVAAKIEKGADETQKIYSNSGKLEKLREKAEIGQEAHRQIEKVIVEKGGKKEVTIDLRDGTRVRKDGVKSDGETYIIIKPKTSSGYRSAKQREKLKHKNGKKTETIYYDPNDPKYLKGSSTYIGPQKK